MDERRQGWKIVQVGGASGFRWFSCPTFLCKSLNLVACWVFFGFGALSLGFGCVGFIMDSWQPATNSEALQLRNW